MAPKKEKSASKKAVGKGKDKGKKSQPPPAKEKPNYPDGIYPIVLTTATQELFKCCVNVDVTEERPYKLLKKDDIIQDMKMRAAVSDFSPVKEIVLEYAEEEMLLVFDMKFTHGQNFYLVLTPEAKARIYKPEIIEVFEDEPSKTPEPKPWISLGSDLEIDEESVKETREKLSYKFSKVRRTFGAPVCFTDRSAADAKDSYLQCASYPDSRFSIKQMQRDCGIQAVPRLQSSSAQTQWKFQRNMFTQYKPRELSEKEIEAILRSENLKKFCHSVTTGVLHALQQENIMNIFTDDFKVLGIGSEAADRLVKVSEGLVLHQAFTDQKHSKGKKISSANWHPTIPGLIAVALTKRREEQLDESTTYIISPAFIVFYSFSDPSNPQLLLECPDDITAFEFCPSNPNIIVGGCMTGQVVLWDISVHIPHLQGTQPNSKQGFDNTETFDLDDNKETKTPVVCCCAVSAIENSHKSPITDVQWLPRTFQVTRTGLPVENTYKVSVQVVTCSPDCTVMFWDLQVPKLQGQLLADRKQKVVRKTKRTAYNIPEMYKHLDRTWKPLFKVSLPKIDTSGEYAPLKFSLEHYTCNGNTDNESNGVAVIPAYNQLRMPSAQTLRTLEDVNTKFYIGTKDGEVVYTDWKLEKDESGRLFSGKPFLCFGTHHKSVNTIQRSPFFKDVVLTTGGWNFAIWKEEVMDGPIFVSRTSEQECTVGCWSLSRPAVFFIGKEDGSIEVWNLLLNTSEPTEVHAHITNIKITCIKPWIASPKQHYLAVTDNLGILRVLNIPKTLYSPSTNEDLKVQEYFEREKDRLKDSLERDELWVKQKKEAEENKKVEPDKPVKFQQDSEEANMKEYSDYMILEENILKSTGL